MAATYMRTGSDMLAARAGFKLVGRADKFEELCTILTRKESNSVIVSGPGGAGISTLALALQARKADPDAPFDIVGKRLFWLDTDGLFGLGDSTAIAREFKAMFSVLERTPESVLIVEDTLDLIEALRNAGLMYVINALTSMVKNGKTQIFLEVREPDLTSVLKCHSDFREHFTLMDLGEPVGDELYDIVLHGARELESRYSVRITNEAVSAAITLSNKYRSLDTGLSRAQPERSRTLLDRAMARYCLYAHSRPPGQADLEAEIDKLKAEGGVDAPVRIAALQAQIGSLAASFGERQAQIKRHFKTLRDGEKLVVELEAQLRALEEQERARSLEPSKDAKRPGDVGFDFLGEASGYTTPEIAKLRVDIETAQKAVEENRARFLGVTAEISAGMALTADMVIDEFSRISGIDKDKLRQNDKAKLIALGSVLRGRVFGQEESVVHTERAVKVWRRGRRTERPLALLFCGPSGVGKTETCKALAEGLFDTDKALNRYDMSEYTEKNDITKLIGAPPGYEGFAAGGDLTNSVRGIPYQVLLFDEIEKAHADIFDLFLGVLDDGRCRDNIGRKVEFGDAIITMTTNIGAEHALDPDLSDEEALERTIRDLKKRFRSEFLNRFEGRENIMLFRKLDMSTIERITMREIERINAFYRPGGIQVDFPEPEMREFCTAMYSPEVGARGMPGKIKAIEAMIIDRQMEDEGFAGTLHVGFDVAGRKFKADWGHHDRRAA